MPLERRPNGRALDQGKVEVVVSRPAESVASQRAETPVVRTRAAWHIDGNGKVRSVVRAQAEIVFANFAAGGEVRNADLVRTVGSVGAGIGLLHAGVDGEGRTAGDGGDAQQLPTAVTALPSGRSKRDVFPVQVLRQAQGEGVGYVEGRRPFLRMRVERILG